MERAEQIIRAMREADDDDRETLKEDLLALCNGPDGAAVRAWLEQAAKGEILEVRWEIEEVLDTVNPRPVAQKPPPPPPEPEPEPEPEVEPRQLKASDLNLVYQDPQGTAVHRTKRGDRWFVSQPDPYTGRFQTFEVPSHQVDALKAELAGSPYWRGSEPL